MSFAEKLIEQRTKIGFSKMELTKVTGVHHFQIGRYENKGAHALDTSAAYLLNRSNDNLANNTLEDKELLYQFKMIERFSPKTNKMIKALISAFILKSNLQNQLAS